MARSVLITFPMLARIILTIIMQGGYYSPTLQMTRSRLKKVKWREPLQQRNQLASGWERECGALPVLGSKIKKKSFLLIIFPDSLRTEPFFPDLHSTQIQTGNQDKGLSASLLSLSLTKKITFLQSVNFCNVQNLPHIPVFPELAGVRHLLCDLAR